MELDRKSQLIADEAPGRGTVDDGPRYPREIVRRALMLRASALILAHNHPSGDPSPSQADIAMTRDVAAAAKLFGIVLHDHVIVPEPGHTPFRSAGLLCRGVGRPPRPGRATPPLPRRPGNGPGHPTKPPPR